MERLCLYVRSDEGSAPGRHYVAKHRALECPRSAVAEKRRRFPIPRDGNLLIGAESTSGELR